MDRRRAITAAAAVSLTLMAAAGGIALSSEIVGAVHDGLRQPRTFETLTGIPQEAADNTRAGWLQLYLARFPERLKPPHPDVALANRWIGGDAALLKSALQAIPRR